MDRKGKEEDFRDKVMRKLTISLLIPLFILSQPLEIPEITVYGERQIRIEPVEKGPLPFEEELIYPIYQRNRATLPSLREKRGIIDECDKGLRVRGELGSKFEGYVIGYLRNFYYPFEIGIDGLYNSDVEEDYFKFFARIHVRDFYFNAAYLDREESERILSFCINGFSHSLSGGISIAYSDSLIMSANLELFLLPIDFELDIDDEYESQLRASYERYPLKAGLSWYKMRLYPELLYFFPFGKDLYLRGTLLARDGISSTFGRLPQFQWECNPYNPYYRVEFGRGGSFGISLLYSTASLTDTMSYLGVSGTYKHFQLEAGYPLKEGNPYLRTGIALLVSDRLDVNLYGFLSEVDHYFLSTDIGFLLTKSLTIGASGTLIKGWKDCFDLTGYLSFHF